MARSHEAVRACLFPGALAVDATVGNGHDTLFLARAVGSGGRVEGLDIQASALTAARERLEQAGALDRVRLHQGGHEALLRILPEAARGRVRAVMFNLGYLPGGDKGVVTRPDSTLAGLEAAAGLLAPGGRIAVVGYPGHPGGAEECEAVSEWARKRRPDGLLVRHQEEPESGHCGPRLLVLERGPVSGED
ncbi:MAG TPA: class I SAM-dependent methyltransferase [Gammaproteobacteria bacterium]|nr:class I SAM-dependent methyltransferase [Gammaproteobacteria bacterium]